MSYSKVITCLHVSEGFYDRNNQLCINVKSNFSCACKDGYGSHLLYFCLYCECFEDLTKKTSDTDHVNNHDTDHVNNEWMKYCVASSNIGLINVIGTMRFFWYSELANSLHLSYSCRKNLFTKL